MKPILLSWNVRGLNEINKRRKVRNLCRQWKADIICLQETKLELISSSIVQSLWGCHFVDWCYLASRGASGGILLMWDRRVVVKTEMYVGEYVVACSFKNTVDDFSWAFAGVYGPNIVSNRRSLWEELAGLISWWDVPWCLGRDFNVTRFPFERSGEARFCLAMMDFSDFISELGLMDLPRAFFLF
jgi:hypothetical protein